MADLLTMLSRVQANSGRDGFLARVVVVLLKFSVSLSLNLQIANCTMGAILDFDQSRRRSSGSSTKE